MTTALLIIGAMFLLAVLACKRLAIAREQMERQLAEAEVDAELRRVWVCQWCGLREVPEAKDV